MSTVSTASAAFYQFFRDRESNTAARQAGDGGPARVATTHATDQSSAAQASDPVRSTGSTTLTPDQVRSHLKTLIAGQVATGKLTSDQVATLQQTLGPNATPDATGAQAAAPAAPGDGSPTQKQFAAAEPSDTYKPSEVLAAFIQNLQSSQPAGASYGSTGTGPARSSGSQVLDFNT